LFRWVSFGADGGYAEYLHVPAYRHILKLEKLSPIEASPLTDAGLTPYRAVKKLLPYLYPVSMVAVIGIGNLGMFAVQILKALTPSTQVIAVDIVEDRLKLASELGAEHVINGKSDVAKEIKKLTGGEGAQAILDMVGSNHTLETAYAAIGRKGIIMVCGMGGGILPYSITRLPMECIVTSTDWGSYTELEEIIAMAEMGKIHSQIQSFPLEDVNRVHRLMRTGENLGHAVITFD
jgi:propanol-preferring alcohol dehydrogenase